jgi:hypothetical protein
MKTGKLILDKKLVQISFENFPSINLGVNINESGVKELNGELKWNPLKIDLTHKYGDKISDGSYDVIYLCEHNSTKTYKLTDCELNSDTKELKFNSCQLFE